MEDRQLTWRKSSRSTSNGGSCVEVAELPDRVMVRDSKLNDNSPVLAVSRAEWRVFIDSLR
jgi:hypothetical protein